MSRGFEIVANQFDDYPIGQLIKEAFVLFICSTTNQGDEPEPIRKFWSFIMRRGLPGDVLSNVKCGVIGLGDSSYLRYNVVGKKLYKRLLQLGAQMLLNICLGDDQHDLGLDAAVDKWLPDFWSEVEKHFDTDDSNSTVDQQQQSSFFKLYEVGQLEDNVTTYDELDENPTDSQEYNHENYYPSKVISNVRVTSGDHFQDTRLVKFSLPQDKLAASLNYSPGDVVMILPENSKDNVDEFINLLNLDSNRQVKISRLNSTFLGYNLFDTIEGRPMKIEQIVKHYFDLNSVPKRSFFEVLATYATDQLEKDKLNEFASTNGQYALYEYCKKPKRSLLEVLIDFPKTTSNLTIDDLFQLVNPIFPRPYSIASSLAECPGELHVLCAVKQLKTLLRKPRLGLCSNYIKQLKSDDEVRIYIKKGTLKIPDDKIPLIMIGSGTGVAPFRSIIQDRVSRNQSLNYLIFGCRNRAKDYYFEDEWTQTNARGLLRYYVAFSRDQPDHRKVYVQHKLWENRKLVWELLSERDGHLMVCGSSNQMSKDVREMLIKIVQDQGDTELRSDSKAESMIDRFETIKKLQFECWD